MYVLLRSLLRDKYFNSTKPKTMNYLKPFLYKIRLGVTVCMSNMTQNNNSKLLLLYTVGLKNDKWKVLYNVFCKYFFV